jgi:hypothetical protein
LIRAAPLAAGLIAIAAAATPFRGKETVMTHAPDAPDGHRPPGPLPYAQGRSFATLDAYLAHLRDHAGPIGQPWYREIRRGVYERVTTRQPRGAPETFTRAELMRRYGFTR